MKKIIVFIFFVFSSSISVAHMAHYNNFNKIEMEIFRNGNLIGYNHYFFNKSGNNTTVTNEIKFKVKLLGKTIFQVEGFGEEKYYKDKLISYNSKTLQNNKKKFVNLVFDKKQNKFLIDGSSYKGDASIDNIIGNWWNHKILEASSQISPISGSVKKQVVTFIGKEKIEQYGKVYNTEHFKLNSKDINTPDNKKINFDVWYDKRNFRILRVSYSRMGNWEYRLKTID